MIVRPILFGQYSDRVATSDCPYRISIGSWYQFPMLIGDVRRNEERRLIHSF
nr:MAG TPA: hypothetical protein [Caudoviricetes sp.]